MADMTHKSVSVRYRTCTVTVFPIQSRGGTYWRFRKGKRFVTRSTLEKAKDEARRYAESTFLSSGRIGLLNEAQTRAVQRMLDADPTLSLVEEFLAWRDRKCPSITVEDARRQFLAAKAGNAGKSAYNVRRLRQRLSPLPGDAMLGSIGPGDLPKLGNAAITRINYIKAWVSFFRWCRRQGWLPKGEETAPELLDRPRVLRMQPATWTRKELDTLIANVKREHLPWLVLGAWAGIRTEEVCPDDGSQKDGIRWEDFHWDSGNIEIRAEVSKTGVRRLAPILPCLAAILRPLAGKGRVYEGLAPHRCDRTKNKRVRIGSKRVGGKLLPVYQTEWAEPETTRLGKLVGGWKINALRHSFISYRSAHVGTAQAALEAGNAESVTRRNYHDAKSKAEADEWFAEKSENN